jgi:putative nucleotidyltransferase with HDIG domain
VPAKGVLLAAVLRPVFGSPHLRPQWTHALEAADVAQQLAEQSGMIPPEEAVLAALVHDIGVLALSLVNSNARRRRERLIAAGCPSRSAERLIFGFDHAEASAVVLKAWRFPESIVNAVRHHHSPEKADSKLAALLYLTEFWTCSEEDIPSMARLSGAACCVGMTTGAIVSTKAEHRLRRLIPMVE